MDTATTRPAAGWYTDPANSSNERWWGGIDWTDHTRPGAAFAPNPPTAQLAIPSAHAAHAAPSQHVAESPLVGSTPPASAPAVTAAPAFTAAPTFSVTTPEPAPSYSTAPAPAYAAAPAPAPAPAPTYAAAPAPVPTYAAAPAPALTAPPAPAFTPPPAPAFTPPPAPAAIAAPQPPAAAPLAPPAGSALVITPAATGTAPIPPASGGVAAMTPEAAAAAAAAVVTIPQYASQLPEVSNPLFGALSAGWVAQPSGEATPAVSAGSGFDFNSMFDSSTMPAIATPSGPVETPKNGKAIAGFILSFLGISLFGLIFSILGLRRAREFESMDLKPAGRVLARWGVALAVISMVLSIGVGVLYATMWSTIEPILASYLPL